MSDRIDDLLAGRTEDASGVTYGDLVRRVVRADLTDDECHFILWELTPFPLVTRPDQLRPYLEIVTPEPQPVTTEEAQPTPDAPPLDAAVTTDSATPSEEQPVDTQTESPLTVDVTGEVTP